MKNVRTPKKISNVDIIKFFKSKNMDSVVKSSKEYQEAVNDMTSDYKYRPQLKDLYRLYQIVYLNKRTTILEFGSGYSSLMFSASLSELKSKYEKRLKISEEIIHLNCSYWRMKKNIWVSQERE